MNQKGFSNVILLVVAITVVLAGAGGYLVLQQRETVVLDEKTQFIEPEIEVPKAPAVPIPPISSQPTPVAEKTPAAGPSAALPKEVLNINLSSPIEFNYGPDLLTYDKIKVYEFRSESQTSTESCLPLRIVETEKSYFICGEKSQRVLVLEGNFYNTSRHKQVVWPGDFRIILEKDAYLESNFSTKEVIEVEPETSYFLRIPFENFEQIPPIFTLEYGASEPIPFNSQVGRLVVDMENRTSIPFESSSGYPEFNFPSIEKIIPSTGTAGDTIAISGGGFEGENIVVFVSALETNYGKKSVRVNSSDGKTLQFKIPSTLFANLGGDEIKTLPRNYLIQVYNQKTDRYSNIKTFTVLSAGIINPYPSEAEY